MCNAYCSTLITFVGIQAIGLENQKKDPFERLHLAFSFSVSLTIPLFAAVTVIHKYMHKKFHAVVVQILSDNRQAFSRGDSLRQLCSALLSNRTVISLNLSGNKIGDSLAGHIAHLLKVSWTGGL